jgi:hypothetical protein
MTRLWTLEEDILASSHSLRFSFKNGAFTLREEIEEAVMPQQYSDSIVHRAIQLHIFRTFGRILKMKGFGVLQEAQI